MEALQVVGGISIACVAFLFLIVGEVHLLKVSRGKEMRVKLVFDYGLPDYDPEKHDPDKTFAFLVYRGVSYAKWVNLKKHFGTSSWKVTS